MATRCSLPFQFAWNCCTYSVCLGFRHVWWVSLKAVGIVKKWFLKTLCFNLYEIVVHTVCVHCLGFKHICWVSLKAIGIVKKWFLKTTFFLPPQHFLMATKASGWTELAVLPRGQVCSWPACLMHQHVGPLNFHVVPCSLLLCPQGQVCSWPACLMHQHVGPLSFHVVPCSLLLCPRGQVCSWPVYLMLGQIQDSRLSSHQRN